MIQVQGTPAHDFSWLRELLIPAFFTILGTAVGYFVALVRDDREATRARTAFLRAVGMELDALEKQLDASLVEVSESLERVKAQHTGPQFAAALRTAVFTGQIGKVRDVDDDLMIDLIHFYSDLASVDQIFQSTNQLSVTFNTTESSGQKSVAGGRLVSSLWVLQAQIKGFTTRLKALRERISKAVMH